MNYGILLSGGTGTRLHSDVPKQYVRVKDRMMITYALETMLDSSYIDRVYIVADERWQDEILEDIERYIGLTDTDSVSFASSGENRQLSILSAMEQIWSDKEAEVAESGKVAVSGEIAEISGNNEDTIFIHDAARPMLSEELISRSYQALSGHDGVMPVLAMKDTVYLSKDGNKVDQLLDRSTIYAGQAPEIFLLDKYYAATKALLPDKILTINGSTEPAIQAGMDIAMIPGDESNFKVTTDDDMKRFTEGI